MIGAIMQPTFNPWLGYFDMIDQTDMFVLYDDVQLSKRSWQVRNRIKTSQGELFLSIPVKKTKHRNDLLIKDAEINNSEKWKKKHLKSIEQAYKKSPFFSEVFDFVHSHYSREWNYLADFNSTFIEVVALNIGLDTKFLSSSKILGMEGDKDTRLAAICNEVGIKSYISPQGSAEYIEEEREGGELSKSGIDVYYHDYKHPEYSQLYGEFEPYYGVLDILFNEGFNNTLNIIRMGRKKNISSIHFRNNILKKN